MTLTPRQADFMHKLVDLWCQRQKPIHYTELAEALGVNKFSAYDMLRVLEGKGLAASDYVLDAGHSGPGRSMVVFYPTDQGRRLVSLGGAAEQAGEDWLSTRERVLRRLRSVRDANLRETLSDWLARLPDRRAPLDFSAHVIAALLLNLRRLKDRPLNAFRRLWLALRTDEPADPETALNTLAGISLGASLGDDEALGESEGDPSLVQRLLAVTTQYQNTLSRLSRESKTALTRFLEEALEALD